MNPQLNESVEASRLKGGKTASFFDSFFVLRPTLIFPLWTMTLAGCWLAVRDPDQWLQWSGILNPGGEIVWWRWLLLAIALTAMYGLVYLLNQIKDVKTDKINKKLFLVAEGALNRRHLINESIVLSILAVLSLIFSGFSHLGLLALGLFLVIGVLYNFTPLALKQKPWGGIIAYAAGGWMFLKLGELVYGNSAAFLIELPYIIAFTSSCLLTNLPDKKGDLAEGKRTFVVAYGEKTTLFIGILGFSLSALTGILNNDWVIALPAIVTAPFLTAAFFRYSIDRVISVNKWAIFLLSLTVGIAFGFPVYILIIILYFPFARWYHKRRFGMVYPSFG